jgi:hypothetical protein
MNSRYQALSPLALEALDRAAIEDEYRYFAARLDPLPPLRYWRPADGITAVAPEVKTFPRDLNGWTGDNFVNLVHRRTKISDPDPRPQLRATVRHEIAHLVEARLGSDPRPDHERRRTLRDDPHVEAVTCNSSLARYWSKRRPRPQILRILSSPARQSAFLDRLEAAIAALRRGDPAPLDATLAAAGAGVG